MNNVSLRKIHVHLNLFLVRNFKPKNVFDTYEYQNSYYGSISMELFEQVAEKDVCTSIYPDYEI